MKRLLLLCAFALAIVGFGSTNFGNVNAQTQEQKEVKNYDIYVGQYQVAPDFILTITNENNKLMGQPTGDEKAEFKPETDPDMFYSERVNARLKFVKDAAGVVVGVVVTIDGKDFPSKKIK